MNIHFIKIKNMKAISKEIKILAPAAIFILVITSFYVFHVRPISYGLSFYIIIIYFLILGINLIFKDKDLSNLERFVWLFILLSFNLIGVICFLIWKNMKKNNIRHSDS